ncbi:MAG: hypothetical protein H7Y37_17270 [Anaerolineae bacterium]|nr:hypothetical protein [Gloeobacterales cyanobacterium ES-bin-313]
MQLFSRFVGSGIAAITSSLVVMQLAVAPSVQAEEITCTGSIGAVRVDNLRVPQGATCTLNQTIVQGTIKVEANATLKASRIQVVGNVQGENAKQVNVLSRSFVGGSIQLVQGGSARIETVQINGDLLFDENVSSLIASRNTIGGSLQAFKNTGGVTISANTIDGNLQCKENVPAPTGGENIVQGNKEDQCAAL